jgi:hypothetical protein
MSDARIKHLIEEKTESRIASLETELDAVKSELQAIKASLVKPEPVVRNEPVRKPATK